MVGLLTVGSLVLGLIAWILPIVNLIGVTKHWAALSIMSLSACAISLCFQIYYNYHLVRIEDWSALMDTMGAVAVASTVLLIVTLALNTITLIVRRGSIARM
ncbi:hypothetical protein [Sporosarcina sp. Marseille-Q4943]|uniref:hypothetical protein n=1 Tax=Sporosarcina sp. Marseille-Q4943 TaxID=2942204 RepID=UPI00208DBB1A|nr:hypothetical protein [Sporosarcina sp. Marseille-Q4943]